MVEGGRFELPNPKERIYSPPRLATSLPLRYEECRQEDLNPQPTDYKSVALPIELHRRNYNVSTTFISISDFTLVFTKKCLVI